MTRFRIGLVLVLAMAPLLQACFPLVATGVGATALIAAAFLFQFGTGPIKGCAVTLVIGLLANVFASYFVSKLLFQWVFQSHPTSTLSI